MSNAYFVTYTYMYTVHSIIVIQYNVIYRNGEKIERDVYIYIYIERER